MKTIYLVTGIAFLIIAITMLWIVCVPGIVSDSDKPFCLVGFLAGYYLATGTAFCCLAWAEGRQPGIPMPTQPEIPTNEATLFTATSGMMPDRFFEDTIGEMQVGDSGWTVPWALSVDTEGRCLLNEAYMLHSAPGGTVQMHIDKTPLGYIVNITGCNDQKWDREPAHYFDGKETDLVPIAQLITG